MPEWGKSIGSIVVMVMIVIAVFGWAFMAGAYAHEVEGWRQQGTGEPPFVGRRGAIVAKASEAFLDFSWNAIVQIPDVFSVIRFNLTNRLWFPLLILGLEAAALFGGYKLKALEQELNRPAKRRH